MINRDLLYGSLIGLALLGSFTLSYLKPDGEHNQYNNLANLVVGGVLGASVPSSSKRNSSAQNIEQVDTLNLSSKSSDDLSP